MVGTLEHVLTLAIDRKLHPDTSTLRDFAKIRSDMIIRSLKGIVVEVNKEVYLSDSHRAHELTFKWALNDRLVKYVQYYFVVNGAVGFTFSCIYTLASFREIKDEVKSIVEALLPRRAP